MWIGRWQAAKEKETGADWTRRRVARAALRQEGSTGITEYGILHGRRSVQRCCWLQFEPPASGFQGGMAVGGDVEPQSSQIRPVRANKTVPCPSDNQARRVDAPQGRMPRRPQPMPRRTHTTPPASLPTLDSRRMPRVPAETSTLQNTGLTPYRLTHPCRRLAHFR